MVGLAAPGCIRVFSVVGLRGDDGGGDDYTTRMTTTTTIKPTNIRIKNNSTPVYEMQNGHFLRKKGKDLQPGELLSHRFAYIYRNSRRVYIMYVYIVI